MGWTVTRSPCLLEIRVIVIEYNNLQCDIRPPEMREGCKSSNTASICQASLVADYMEI